MLGLYGLIKNELEKQNKFPEKFQDWKTALYGSRLNTNDLDLSPLGVRYSYSQLGSLSNVYCTLFGISSSDSYPIDAVVDSWEFIVKVNRLRTYNSSLGDTTLDHCGLKLHDGPTGTTTDGTCDLVYYPDHIGWNGGLQFAGNTSGGSRKSYSKTGYLWLRATSSANSKAFTFSYSTNGSAFTQLATYSGSRGVSSRTKFSLRRINPSLHILDHVTFKHNGTVILDRSVE